MIWSSKKKKIIHNFTKLSYTHICAKMKVRKCIKVEEDNLYAAYDHKFYNRQEKNQEYVNCLCNVLLLPKCFVRVTLVFWDLFTAREIIGCSNTTDQRVTTDLIFSIILIKICSN